MEILEELVFLILYQEAVAALVVRADMVMVVMVDHGLEIALHMLVAVVVLVNLDLVQGLEVLVAVVQGHLELVEHLETVLMV